MISRRNFTDCSLSLCLMSDVLTQNKESYSECDILIIICINNDCEARCYWSSFIGIEKLKLKLKYVFLWNGEENPHYEPMKQLSQRISSIEWVVFLKFGGCIKAPQRWTMNNNMKIGYKRTKKWTKQRKKANETTKEYCNIWKCSKQAIKQCANSCNSSGAVFNGNPYKIPEVLLCCLGFFAVSLFHVKENWVNCMRYQPGPGWLVLENCLTFSILTCYNINIIIQHW